MQSKTSSSIIWGGIVGNTLEWYEYALFTQFVPLFSKLFFPEKDPTAVWLYTFIVFAVGFISRPFGTVVLGHIGDKYGRKKALMISILILTIPTTLTGLLPTYQQVGLLAPILMTVVRILQGFPVGGEFTGVMCYLVECATPGKRSFMACWAGFGSQLGILLSIGDYLLIHALITPADLMSWGWRISFLLGSIIGLGGWFLRSKLKESPHFVSVKHKGIVSSRPVLESLQSHKVALLRVICLSTLPVAAWIMVFVYQPLYVSEILHLASINTQLLLIAVLVIISNIFTPLFGYLGDKIHPKKLLIPSAVLIALLACPFFFATGRYPGIALACQISLVILISVHGALLPVLITELFPTHIRYSGVGIGYNTCVMLFSGLAPPLSLYLTEVTKNSMMPGFFVAATALVSFVALITLPKERLVD